ncbi:PREDICTED: cytochrome b5-like isoform X2 [Atta colombica]|uniref:cytochrome b5-like isoform X2 n=1 Tax=Atta colombica TaxID=520822 RepID=UPI00084C73D5|nr:PREDICTED: cytochrome b5-like isoform X2 [Atta colombica]
MSLDRHQQKRSLLTSASRSRNRMDLTLRSFKLRDVKPSKENFLQVERDSVTERNDTIGERKCRLKEKSRDEFRIINLAEVAWHDTPDNCWLVIYDYVYDCTEFLNSHPGGQDILLEHAGRDATLAFISTGHSAIANATLESRRRRTTREIGQPTELEWSSS